MTLQDMFLLALKARGEKIVKLNAKAVVMTYQQLRLQHHYIGKSGSLRIGRNVKVSIPASDRYKQELIAEAKAMPQAMPWLRP